MAEYTPPPKSNIPFNFSTGGYTPPDFDKIALNFTKVEVQQQIAALGAAIKGVQTYQQETYTFLKYCETYIVGYSQHGVQIIRGKCHYGGIRDLGGYIKVNYSRDLPAWIAGVVTKDLTAEIFGLEPIVDLGAIIGAHQPRNLGAIIDIHAPEDLTAYIRGFDFRNLPAAINSIHELDLPASVYGIPPVDLLGYLKVWPQADLPGTIHGFDIKDLGAFIDPSFYTDLSATVQTHPPRNIRAWVKGWVREATYDLGTFIHGFTNFDLGAIINATSMVQLPAYLFPIQPVDIPAFIYGWDTKNLQGIIAVSQYPWNLSASINITGSLHNLPAAIYGRPNAVQLENLAAYILVTQGRNNLTANVLAAQARNLSAFIDPGKDLGNLLAEIRPKIIRLTGIISMITMEHRDMSATISIPCFYSNLKNLSAYIRAVYQSNLSASLNAKGYVFAEHNLGASFGYAPNTTVQDKLPINLSIAGLGFRTEDMIDIRMSVFRGGLSLGAYIYAERHPRDLTAQINGLEAVPYDFETWKSSERVFKRTYSQVVSDYEDVSISFQSIVKDYFYSSGSDVVAKVDKYTHFVTKVASYYSPATSRSLNRKLHKVKYLYDMRHFDTTDEAMRYAIWYVTTTPINNLNASINSISPRGDRNLLARIGATQNYSLDNNLTSYINGEATHTYDVVISYTDDGVGYLQF